MFKPNQHEGNLVHLLEELSRHRYIEFGIKLGLKPHMIENVTSPQRKEPRICFMSVLETWLKLGSKDRTWGILATALENVGEIEIAKKVKQENPNLEKEVSPESHATLSPLLHGVNVSRWDELGAALKVPNCEIRAIANESEYRKQLSDILNLWLKSSGCEPTPETLLAAVKVVNEGLAEKLSKSSELYALVGRTPPGYQTTMSLLEKQCYEAFYSDRKEDGLQLLEQLENPKSVRDTNGWTLLHCAAYRGWLDVVELLTTKYGCDVNITSISNNKTPVFIASREGHLNVVKYLRTVCNCDMTIKSRGGNDPLSIACKRRHNHIVEYLSNPNSTYEILADLKTQNSDLQEKIQKLEDEKDEILADLKTQNSDLQEKIQKLEDEKDEILADLKTQNSDLQEKIQKLEDEKDEILADLKTQNSDLQEKIKKLEDEKDEILADLKTQNSDLQEKIQKLEDEKDEILADLKTQNSDLQEKIKKLEDEKDESLADVKTQNSDLQEKIQKLEDEKAIYKCLARKKDMEIQQLQNRTFEYLHGQSAIVDSACTFAPDKEREESEDTKKAITQEMSLQYSGDEATQLMENGELKDKSQDCHTKEEMTIESLQQDKAVQFDFNVPMQDLLHNALVVAENAFHVVGNHEQSFIWNECGFRLYVPEGTLLPSETCTVAVKALIAGRFVLPKNTELVSGLYAISSSRKFQAKVKIEVQHCVLLNTKAQSRHLRFIKAYQTQPGASYHFSLQEAGEFPINSHYCGLWQSEFSIVGAVDSDDNDDDDTDDTDDSDDCGIVQSRSSSLDPTEGSARQSDVVSSKEDSIHKSKREKEYRALTFYEKDSRSKNSWNFIFIAIKHLNVHVKVVVDSLSEVEKCGGFHFRFMEGGSQEYIGLKLNVVENENGWKLKPYILPCQIAKEDIDLLGSQQLKSPKKHNDSDPLIYPDLPMCKVNIFASDGASCDFHHEVPVEGIIEKKSVIIQRILLNDDNQGSLLLVSTPSSHLQNTKELNLLTVLTATVQFTRWYNLGLILGIAVGTLDRIEEDKHNEDDRKREMLKCWLNTASPSWLSLVGALRSPLINMQGLANEIADCYHVGEHKEEQVKKEEKDQKRGKEIGKKRKQKTENTQNKRRIGEGKEEEEEEEEEEQEEQEEKQGRKRKNSTGNIQNKKRKGKEKAEVEEKEKKEIGRKKAGKVQNKRSKRL